MRNIVLVFLTVFFGINVFASDQMDDEIVCNKVHQPGSADDGLTVVLKSNETSWVKLVDIIENGYLGPRLIASIQVPLQPELLSVNNGDQVKMVYRGNGLELAIGAIGAVESDEELMPLTGLGQVKLALPGYPVESVDLICEYAN